MSASLRSLRLAAWIASGFALGILVGSAWAARQEAMAQDWSGQGIGWLALDFLARNPAWRAGATGAVVGLACATGLGVLARRGDARPARESRLRRLAAVPGHPIVALVLLVLGLFGPRLLAGVTRPAPPPDAPNVLVVLVDTWRADHAGFLGYERDVTPNLDRLTASGIVFERAQAQAGWTKPSVGTLFTGLMPSRHGAVSEPLPPPVRGTVLAPRMTTFTEVLRARGWDTAMWSNNPHIVPLRGFAQGAGRFFDYVHHPDRRRGFDRGTAARMLPDVERWLEQERDASRPFCAYVHVLDPHAPYGAPPEFRGRFDHSDSDFRLSGEELEELRDGRRDPESLVPEVQRVIDKYDEEILSVDHALGPFLTRVLEEHPETVVVLCGDHGEEFSDHGQFGHAHTLYEELTHVPLVLWAPGLSGRRIGSQVRLMDVYPTLLELTGSADSLSPGVQGESLVPVIRGEETADRLAPAESGGDRRPAWQWRAISDGRWKLLRREVDAPSTAAAAPRAVGDGATPPYDRLFDLGSDPGELHSLHVERAADAAALLEAMRSNGWYVTPTELLQLAPGGEEVPGEDLELLRDLGYVGTDS